MSTTTEHTQAPAAGTDRAQTNSPGVLSRSAYLAARNLEFGEDNNLPTAERVGGDHENQSLAPLADQNSPVGGREHTPGPWIYAVNNFDGHEVGLGSADDLAGGGVSGFRDGGDSSYLRIMVSSDRPEADARLIAAAPELLEALKSMYKDFVAFREIARREGMIGTLGTGSLEQARTAIAKATGKEDA